MSVVPLVPPTDDGLLEQHRGVRVEARDALGALPDAASAVYRWWSRRRLVESIGNLFLDDRPLLIPPHRRHLHDKFTGRLDGCLTALRHVDARVEMHRRGHVTSVLGTDTPYVLHALAESRNPGGSETNPGLPRLVEAGFDPTQSAFLPPPAHECEALVSALVDVANVDEVPAIVRAGWACATLLAVHPFVDGNGRTARLVFQLLASSDEELGFDWGTVEQWAMRRVPYVRALKASQAPSLPGYDGRRVDTSPFIEFAVRTSIDGAEVGVQRMAWFATAWDLLAGEVDADSDDGLAVIVELTVGSAWSASLAEIEEVVGLPHATIAVNRLVRDGRLIWDRRRLLRLSPDHPLRALR
ncbi:hypothetical protein YM304_03830 [Ilumatobacter coccineus YM16-304]|uniref:Fido domain-containing protein n=2 Tax=Ilumatobacter coccineus TaxID=467094 RepID=A0A6C7E003_ILUCY|nr:hypothetical protein YM304_03830 [Ilumatobacter coccineus YM16-304]